MRMKYSKDEAACLLSHHEVQTALVRWLRRSALPLAYSEGFNQRVRIETGIPTSVGMISLQEYVDVFLESAPPLIERCRALERTAPPGLRFLAAADVPLATPSLMGQPAILQYDFCWPHHPAPGAEQLKAAMAAFLEQKNLPVKRENSKSHTPKDIRKYVLTAELTKHAPLHVHVGVFFDQSGTIRMDEILLYLFGLEKETALLPVITREAILLNVNGSFKDPMEAAVQIPRSRNAR